MKFNNQKLQNLYNALNDLFPNKIGQTICGFDYEGVAIPVQITTEFGDIITNEGDLQINLKSMSITIPYEMAKEIIKKSWQTNKNMV